MKRPASAKEWVWARERGEWESVRKIAAPQAFTEVHQFADSKRIRRLFLQMCYFLIGTCVCGGGGRVARRENEADSSLSSNSSVGMLGVGHKDARALVRAHGDLRMAARALMPCAVLHRRAHGH